MSFTSVVVKEYIEEVVKDEQYEGYFEIEGIKFYYEIVFTVPYHNLQKVEGNNRDLFQLTMRRSNSSISLDDDEYEFFLSMVLSLVEKFRMIGSPSRLKITKFISLTSETRKMLVAPKFGCEII